MIARLNENVALKLCGKLIFSFAKVGNLKNNLNMNGSKISRGHITNSFLHKNSDHYVCAAICLSPLVIYEFYRLANSFVANKMQKHFLLKFIRESIGNNLDYRLLRGLFVLFPH